MLSFDAWKEYSSLQKVVEFRVPIDLFHFSPFIETKIIFLSPQDQKYASKNSCKPSTPHFYLAKRFANTFRYNSQIFH